jgi:hypothetical protein
MSMIVQGIIAAVTFLWLLSYFPFRRVFGYAFLTDVICTSVMLIMFAGSFGGMMTGVIAGLTLSMFLRFGGAVFGRERLAIARAKGRILPTARWERVS